MEIAPELRAYLTRKKWSYKPLGDENIAVRTCPFCKRSKFKFSIHATKTVYRCFHCDERGNLYQLKKHEGDLKGVVSAARLSGERKKAKRKLTPMALVERWHGRLLEHERALEYCDKRGLDSTTIEHFKLGVRKGKRGWWLAIPHVVDGECENVKQRTLPPAEKTFRRVVGAASVLFNQDVLAQCEEVVLCEAEIDAMSFWQAGVRNVVSLTCGAGTFLPEWYDLLVDKERVVLVLDADVDGQNGARAIARRLGFDKCHNVLLPLHDANEVLTEMGPHELARTIETAERFEVAGVMSAEEVIAQCRDDEELTEQGLLTQWPEVNALMGNGWQPGDLVVLSARVKVGKTTWALNVSHFQAEQGVPALVHCLEMSPKRLMQKVVGSIRQTDYNNLTRTDWEVARYHLRGVPLYFIEPEWGKTPEVEPVFEKIREAVKRYGVRLLVFDHLHFLCRSLQYVTTEIGQVTRAFKQLAEELEIVVVLVAQPKKIGSDRVMRYEDIKDSAAIPADADQVVIMHRNARVAGLGGDMDSVSDSDVLEPRTLIRVDAARFQGGGECFLHYEGAYARFYSMPAKGR